MNFVLKLFKVIIVVIVVLIFGVVVFVSVFNANKYKPRLLLRLSMPPVELSRLRGILV